MPSIQELLENLGVDDSTQEKNASAGSTSFSEREIEKAAEDLGLISKEDETTTKVASQNNGGTNMKLQDLYEAYFGEESEKTASAEYGVNSHMEKDAAAELEAAGEQAGRAFSENLTGRLMKFAMEQAMESAATEARDGSSATEVPGNVARSPQLAQNKPADAKEGLPMDLTPQHYDLLGKAVAKKVLEAKLEKGEPEELSHEVFQVDSGLSAVNTKSQKDA